MIITSTQLIEVILSGAKNTNDCPWMTSYADITTTAFTPASTTGVTNGATAVTIVAAPAGSTERHIKWINVFNADVVPTTVIIRINTSSTYTKFIQITLAINETLEWDASTGWRTLTANGEIKTTGVGTAGRLIKQTIYLTGTGATHTFTAGAASAIIEGIAQGGGGGGASFSSPNMGFGAGGAAGGYFSVRVTGIPTTATYSVGSAAGGGGGNTGGTGAAGADTSITVGATIYTAKGGSGGVGMAAGSTLITVAGGPGVAGTNGDILSPGAAGANGIRLSGTTGGSGEGGASVYGAGGAGLTTNSAGKDGGGYGAGGSGAAAVSASSIGGTGSRGAIIITEFA